LKNCGFQRFGASGNRESAAAACLKEGSAYGDLLLRLTESELIECEQRAAERRIKNRQVPCN
jgi:hypothetical protein